MDILLNFVHKQCAIFDPSDPVHRDCDATAVLWKDKTATKIKCKGELNSFHLYILGLLMYPMIH